MADVPPPLDANSFREHARFVKSLARELARDDDEADEVTARTFAAAVEQRPREGATLRGWFARVASRVVAHLRRDEMRRSARERIASRDERAESRDADPAAIAARAELIERVAAAFASLDEPYRATLYRRFYDEWPVTRIAANEGVPADTVKTRVRRGLQRLRERLDAAHRGRRAEWRALAIAVATRGGAIVAVSKVKVAAVAAVLAAIAAVSTWQAVARANRERGVAETATTREPEGARPPVAATSNGDDAPAAAPATAHRAEESIPFASGVVVDSSGAPIAGVLVVPALVVERTDGVWQVSALDASSAAHDALATTADDGRFHVDCAPRNLAGLLFFKPGLVVGEWFDLSARPKENADHRIEIESAARVHGRVIDTSERPIEFTFVQVHPDPSMPIESVAAAAEGAPKYVRGGPWQSVSAFTDADGRFEIASVHSVPCSCWISAAGYGRFSTQRKLVERDTELEIVLHRGTAVLVDVRDAKTKAPVRGARALTYDSTGTQLDELHLPYEEWLGRQWDGKRHSPPGRLTIWCQGRFPEPNSPVATRTLKIAVFAEGYRPAELSLPLKRDAEPPHETLELEPCEPVAALAGTVAGASAATLELRFDRPYSNPDIQNAPPLARIEVGADGRFAFHDLPPATYRLSGSAPGCAPIWSDVTAPRDDLSLQFAPAANLVARVVDTAGAPAPGEVVVLQSTDEQRAWQAVAGADGCARFEGLPTGTFDVLAHMPIRGQSSSAPPRTTKSDNYFRDERITLVAGDNGPIVLPKLERRSATLHFEFADGSPVADAKLLRVTEDRGPANWSWHESERLWALDLKTDGDGFVDVDLYPGTYEVTVVDGGIQSFTKFAVPRRDLGAIEIQLSAPNRFGVVRGRVVTSPGERPITGWSVVACPISASDSSSFLTDAVTTDDDGRFRIDRCPVGPLLVVVRNPAKDGFRGVALDCVTNAQTRINLLAGGEKEITIPIPCAESSELPTVQLDLDVTSAVDGRPIPGVQVLVTGTIGEIDHYLLSTSLPTDSEGRLRQRFPVCERYRVRLHPPEIRSDPNGGWKTREVEALPKEGMVRLSVELERGDRTQEH
jgi:RNA polymerase sigma-70 factor (ECF subfamily)